MWSARCDIFFKELYFHDRSRLVFRVGLAEILFAGCRNLNRKCFNYNKPDPEEFSIKYYIFTMLCQSVPRFAPLSMNFRSSHFFCAINFFWHGGESHVLKVNDSGKIHLITGKPAYWATCIGRFFLFCFVFSSRPNHAEFRIWKVKTPLSLKVTKRKNITGTGWEIN